jgi:hypothetical protein
VRYTKLQTKGIWGVSFRRVFANGKAKAIPGGGGVGIRTLCLRQGIDFDGCNRMYNRKRCLVSYWKRGVFRLPTVFCGSEYDVLGMGMDE